MKRRMLVLLAVVCLLLTAMPLTVSAEGAVATLHANGELVGEYTTLNDAFVAARGYKLADNAVVTLLSDIDVGATTVKITKGAFTIDLNGKTVYGTASYLFTMERTIIGDTRNITITGDGTMRADTGTAITTGTDTTLTIKNGNFSGTNYGILHDGATLTVNDGTIYGENRGISNSGGTVVINDGSVSGNSGIVNVGGGTIVVQGGTINGDSAAFAQIFSYRDKLTVSGGIISGQISLSSDDNITLTGGTFVGGISCGKALNSLLGEDMAYWQGDTMLQVADDAKSITGGDVTVKKACHHEEGTPAYVDNGDDHTVTYSCCHLTLTEAHVFDHVYDGACPCGSTREVDTLVTFAGNSVSEDVSGLAFRFNVAAEGMQVDGTTAIYDVATIGGYKLLGMGATATNGVETIDIPCVYLCELEADSCGFAVRIKNIPVNKYDAAITVVPYVILEMDGAAVTVYGEEQTSDYNSVKG